MNRFAFNWQRFCAIVAKEFIQMRRDRLTFAMMLGIPMIQLILFGYAINSDPKHLPTAIYAADNSVFSRTIVWAMRNSSYFDITREPRSEAEIQQLLAQGTVQFAVEIPVDFSRKLIRGEQPDLLLESLDRPKHADLLVVEVRDADRERRDRRARTRRRSRRPDRYAPAR